MIRFFSCLTFCLLLAFSGLHAQEVFGLIKDQKNGKPIAFANIFLLANQNRGVISNEQGQFRFKLGLDDGQDTLVITELGYETLYMAISEITTDTFEVRMKERSLPLPEVTVFSDEHLREIVRNALERLPKQYGNPRTLMNAYYREYSITDTAYSEMMEAFVTIEDGKFMYPPREGKVYLKEFRRTLDHRNIPEDVKFGYKNGVYNIYQRFPYVLARVNNLFKRQREEFLDNYRFYNNGEYLEGTDTLIAIGFIFANNANSGTAESSGPFRLGELTIRKSDFGILRLRQGNEKDQSYNEIFYQKVGEKYYPSRIRLVHSFSFDEGRRRYFNNRSLHILNVYRIEEWKEQGQKKGKYLRPEYGMRGIRYDYNRDFWAERKMLVRIPAPDALELDLARQGDLHQQFYQTSRGKNRNPNR